MGSRPFWGLDPYLSFCCRRHEESSTAELFLLGSWALETGSPESVAAERGVQIVSSGIAEWHRSSFASDLEIPYAI